MAGGRSFLQRLLRPFLPLGDPGGPRAHLLPVFSERTGFVREVLDLGLKRITLPVLNAFRGGDAGGLVGTADPATRHGQPWPPSATVHWRPVRDEGKDRWDTAQPIWQGDTIAGGSG